MENIDPMDDGPTSSTKSSAKSVNPKLTTKTSLATEWSLFWESVTNDRPVLEEDFGHEGLQPLSLKQIQDMTKGLSSNRKKLNQKIETINKEIDLNTAKLESLKLVGGEELDTIQRIHELSDQGQKLVIELQKIDEQLKATRLVEARLLA